ncbi:DUF645 family protein [Vibrio cholerae]|uniref:DUF645 family protein n=1 Tax=Vibrio cholerae TaxID=666 RepID=UPI00069CC081|nr:DUF645 family protein [Vibrio cholerae]
MLLDVQHGQFGFIKGGIIAVIWFSLSRTINCGQLNLECFEFWLPKLKTLKAKLALFDAFA